MRTECTAVQLSFEGHGTYRVVADFGAVPPAGRPRLGNHQCANHNEEVACSRRRRAGDPGDRSGNGTP
jgi:hypothetical protein